MSDVDYCYSDNKQDCVLTEDADICSYMFCILYLCDSQVLKTACFKDEIKRLKVRGGNYGQIIIKRWVPLPGLLALPLKSARRELL